MGPGECQSPARRRCTLCAASVIDYAREVAVKEQVLRAFWQQVAPGEPLDSLVRSPRGRGYRSVTKRKVFAGRGRIGIGLIDPSEGGTGKFDALRCVIEPPDHGKIYAVVRREIGRPSMEALAEQLLYVIVKGTDTELSVIFNVREAAPGVTRAANELSKKLSDSCRSISGTFLYAGDADGGYYQGTRNARARHPLRKLFGRSQIGIHLGGRTLLYSPLSFSQVNHSILPLLTATAGALLNPGAGSGLYDLYCGYGLFALSFADRVRSVIGIERSPESIDSARANAERLGARNVRFVRNEITAQSLSRILQGLRADDVVLLDPPRGGTAEGVVECIAAHAPARALHIFCNIDLIARDISRWRNGGYRLARTVPLDLFPGTPNIEMMLLFERA